MSWDDATGHHIYVDERDGRVGIGCDDCHKVQDMFSFDIRRASAEKKRAAQMYIFAYFLNEPCERDSESLLSEK